MPLQCKDLCIVAAVSAGSMLAGGVLGYYVCQNKFISSKQPPPRGTEEIHKSFEDDLVNPIDKYIWDHSNREPKHLFELRDHTIKNVQWSIALTDPLEAQLFRLLIQTLDARKCIEVGSYTGYNTLSMALTVPHDGIVYTLDNTEKWIKEGIPFFEKAGVRHKIDIRIGGAVETLDDLIKDRQAGTFDFIYVDADKPNYVTYFEKGLELLRNGGIIAFDNTLLSGRVVDYEYETDPVKKQNVEGIDKVNKMIRDDARVQISFLKISDGVTLCYKI